MALQVGCVQIPNAEADSYRMISLPLDSAKSPQVMLQIAVPMTLIETQYSERLRLLQIGIPIVLLISWPPQTNSGDTLVMPKAGDERGRKKGDLKILITVKG